MIYDKTDCFRFINSMEQAVLEAPYAKQIPRDALVEMIGVLTKHYNARGFPIPTAMNIGPALNASRTSPSTGGAETAEPRFFMDHGIWHDRETGQRLYTQDQQDAVIAQIKDDAWNALEAAGIARTGWLTLAEAVQRLAAPNTEK